MLDLACMADGSAILKPHTDMLCKKLSRGSCPPKQATLRGVAFMVIVGCLAPCREVHLNVL